MKIQLRQQIETLKNNWGFYLRFRTMKAEIKYKKLICTSCGSSWVLTTYDGYWCKWCKNEF